MRFYMRWKWGARRRCYHIAGLGRVTRPCYCYIDTRCEAAYKKVEAMPITVLHQAISIAEVAMPIAVLHQAISIAEMLVRTDMYVYV